MLERIEREAGRSGLLDDLTRMPASDLQSLLLEVYSRRAVKQSPAAVLSRYRESRFTSPAPMRADAMLALMQTALSRLPNVFEALELSPLAPLGACSALATVSQKKIVSTIRNLEVASDPTNVLALECALRRKSNNQVHLAATQRVVRAQALPEGPGYFAHFRIFGMCSAARGGAAFERQALCLQLSFHLSLLKELLPQARISLDMTDVSGNSEKFLQEVLLAVGESCPGTELGFDPDRMAGRGYYRKCCFKIKADDVEIGDGGFTDWTARLLGDKNEKLLISGLGMERLLAMRLAVQEREEDAAAAGN
jgi:hypothetical protein